MSYWCIIEKKMWMGKNGCTGTTDIANTYEIFKDGVCYAYSTGTKSFKLATCPTSGKITI